MKDRKARARRKNARTAAGRAAWRSLWGSRLGEGRDARDARYATELDREQVRRHVKPPLCTGEADEHGRIWHDGPCPVHDLLAEAGIKDPRLG